MIRQSKSVIVFARILLVCVTTFAFALSSTALQMPQSSISAEIENRSDSLMEHCAPKGDEELGVQDTDCCDVGACNCPCMSVSGLEADYVSPAQPFDHGLSGPELNGASPAGLSTCILKPPPIS